MLNLVERKGVTCTRKDGKIYKEASLIENMLETAYSIIFYPSVSLGFCL